MPSLVIFLLFHARISSTCALDERAQNDGSPSENYGSPAPESPINNISPRVLSSNEQHALQKAAMYATIQSASNYSPDDTNSVFTSEEEQRAYYYFHAGIAMATSNTMKMTPPSSDDLDNNEEGDENTSKHDDDNYYSYLEWLLENELESVTRRLNESERNNNNDVTNNGSKEQQPDVNVKIEEDTNKEEVEVDLISQQWIKLLDSLSDNTAAAKKDTPYESIHKQYTQEYQHFKCHEYPIHTLITSNVEAEEIWTELYHYYMKFALDGGVEVDVQLKKRRLSCNPDLYINFTTPSLDLSDSENNSTNNSTDRGSNNTNTTNSSITESSKKTTAVVPIISTQNPRLHAAKNFSKDEVVYSHEHSTYYFSTISQWTSFLRSLPSKKLQCAAIQLTIFKRISRPGRWLLGLVLDEGIFIRKRDQETKERKGNVALYDIRTLDYIATRYIRKGEEIVDDGPTVEG